MTIAKTMLMTIVGGPHHYGGHGASHTVCATGRKDDLVERCMALPSLEMQSRVFEYASEWPMASPAGAQRVEFPDTAWTASEWQPLVRPVHNWSRNELRDRLQLYGIAPKSSLTSTDELAVKVRQITPDVYMELNHQTVEVLTPFPLRLQRRRSISQLENAVATVLERYHEKQVSEGDVCAAKRGRSTE